MNLLKTRGHTLTSARMRLVRIFLVHKSAATETFRNIPKQIHLAECGLMSDLADTTRWSPCTSLQSGSALTLLNILATYKACHSLALPNICSPSTSTSFGSLAQLVRAQLDTPRHNAGTSGTSCETTPCKSECHASDLSATLHVLLREPFLPDCTRLQLKKYPRKLLLRKSILCCGVDHGAPPVQPRPGVSPSA